MPTISRLFLKIGLLYFVLALASGIAMASVGAAWGPLLLPTYLHLFVVGWITQIIIGVALWLFPKWTKEQPRGREWLSWTALVTLNLGLLMRVAAEPGHAFAASDSSWREVWAVMLVVSAVLQWVGGMAFLINIWGRIQGKKTRPKKRAPSKKASADKNTDENPDKNPDNKKESA